MAVEDILLGRCIDFALALEPYKKLLMVVAAEKSKFDKSSSRRFTVY